MVTSILRVQQILVILQLLSPLFSSSLFSSLFSVFTNNRTGEVFTWGGNANGQLGHGDNEPSGKPRVVKDLRPSFISSVACGAAFTLAMSSM